MTATLFSRSPPTLLGRRMPDLDLTTTAGPSRVFALLRGCRGALLRFEGETLDATPWADRVDAVDALYDSVFRALLTHMMGDARTITPSLELLLVSRNLERVADLATNIGEDAVYVAEAKQIRHRAELLEAEPAGPAPGGA